jgi:hypothetical protein
MDSPFQKSTRMVLFKIFNIIKVISEITHFAEKS